MKLNQGFTVGIIPLMPQGTNSTMFTECCGTAICRDESNCPSCGGRVIGYDAETNHARETIRWKNATRNWKRKK